LIGAGEPGDYASTDHPFASHYDQGRITRVTASNPVWSELAARSIQRYEDIANRSGIKFHDARGLAQASLQVDASIAHAVERGGTARRIDRDWLRTNTGITVSADHPGGLFFEDAPAGMINPRELIRALTQLAQRAGAVVVDAPASAVSVSSEALSITCGTSVTADRILLATGAYGADLLGIDLALERRLRTILLADLGPGESIPTFIDDAPPHDALDEIYWVPPVPFPNGSLYLKIGGDSLPMHTADSVNDIAPWFAGGGSQAEAAALQETLQTLLPTAQISSVEYKPCVVTYTKSGLPYIGAVEDRVTVALGGCGASAKSSDEIGRLAAQIATGANWEDAVLPADLFTPQLA